MTDFGHEPEPKGSGKKSAAPKSATVPVPVADEVHEATDIAKAGAATIETSSADIGNWEATSWKGLPMWRHKKSGATSFDESFVRKSRHN